MARQRCLRRLKSPPERSSRRIQNGGAVSSSSTSWTASPRLFRTASFMSSSTISTPEVWFSILQGQSLSGASFTSLKQLQEHIDAYIDAYNEKAEPFVWAKKKVRQRRFKGRRITQL